VRQYHPTLWIVIFTGKTIITQIIASAISSPQISTPAMSSTQEIGATSFH
jgi:hypothetical protein